MIAYASRTRTRRNIAARSAARWGWIVGPLDCGGPILGGMRHAIDNGAWPAFNQGIAWDARAFLACLAQHARGADFVVAPDIVLGGDASLSRTLEWLPALESRDELAGAAILIAVQDGMSEREIAPLITGRRGLFLGGSTEWKLSTMARWGQLAHERRCWFHVGRVNSVRRIALCGAAGATSFDGTSVTRFAKTITTLDAARGQRDFFAPGGADAA